MKKLVHYSSPFRLLVLALFLPTLAQAHTGFGHTHGFAAGVAHPLLGLDHLCAMIAVGLWAVQRGGRAVWVVPFTFVSVMMLGGALGMAGSALPGVEPGVVASVLVLGVLIAAAVRLPVAASAGIVGIFALCHGHAHGAEMPESASACLYAAGFIAVTSTLHLGGIALGLLIQRWSAAPFVRYAGGAITACGLYLCFA